MGKKATGKRDVFCAMTLEPQNQAFSGVMQKLTIKKAPVLQ